MTKGEMSELLSGAKIGPREFARRIDYNERKIREMLNGQREIPEFIAHALTHECVCRRPTDEPV